MSSFRTHYDNLQVAETASIDVIKGAYKFLSQKWHPDKHPDNRAGAEHIMRIINDAYVVLSDPEKRKAHDLWIAENRQRQAQQARDAGQASQFRGGEEQASDVNDFTDDPQADSSQWEVSQKDVEVAPHSPFLNVLCRFVARLIDLYLFVLLLGLAALAWSGGSAWLNDVLNNRVTAGILAVILWIPVEALFLYAFGSTPGKWLLGIDVQKRFGETLNIFEAMQRSVGVAVLGMAGGIPPLFVVTNALAFRKYLVAGSTLWDESLGVVVKHRKWTPLHLTSAALVIMVLLAVVIKSQYEAYTSATSFHQQVDQKSLPVDQSIPGLQVTNDCKYTVKLALRYSDLNAQHRTEGWWYVKPDTSLKFTDDRGKPLKTRSDEWYFYSSIVEGPAFTWDGQYKYRFNDAVLPMQKVEDESGERSWVIDCPGVTTTTTVTPSRKAVKKQPRAIKDEDICVIKGIMTNEELARCRGY